MCMKPFSIYFKKISSKKSKENEKRLGTNRERSRQDGQAYLSDFVVSSLFVRYPYRHSTLMLAASKRCLVRLESLRQAGLFEFKNSIQDNPISLKEP